ncbi:MAG: glutamate--tRNA ligase [Bacteroidales bacterium]|jgi:glutamyl-tRNA synthetase|nr:glutamate--tRNA ligase [Bacteroidales bacterium]
MNPEKVRVRFAPSPTGPLHLGGVRTALYNYLFARKHGGDFILRIEDTDRQRFVNGAEQYIIESLNWCGIHFDEDVVKGGPYSPYRQSDRSSLYKHHIGLLLNSGHAYYAFDSAAELEEKRKQGHTSGMDQFQYNFKTRMLMKNSLSLPEQEVRNRIARGEAYVVRIRIPEEEVVVFNDIIRGEITVHTGTLDDKVLFKSDGLPTYHLANVVDDYLMKISHVIRGEEWLPSAPMHLLLYRFFGWEENMPKFAHLPLILKPEGNGKLSKRDGDRLGFPVFPLAWTDPVTGDISHGYREDGYLPEAFINILALLGWNPGTEKELFSMEELIQSFSIERVGKHGSKFDPEKAKWFNHQYLIHQPDNELLRIMKNYLTQRDISALDDYVLRVVHLTKERANLTGDLWSNSWFFFQAPLSFDEKAKNKIWQPTTGEIVREFATEIKLSVDFNKDVLHVIATNFTERKQIKLGQLLTPLRLLIVGSNQGPGIMDVAEILGKQEFLSRIETGLSKMGEC